MFLIEWVNWSAKLLWTVLKVWKEIYTIRDLNDFDTNDVHPLYPPPPQPWPQQPPRPSFFTCLPRPVSTCWLVIVELGWLPIRIAVSVRWSFAFIFPFFIISVNACWQRLIHATVSLRWSSALNFLSLIPVNVCWRIFLLK